MDYIYLRAGEGSGRGGNQGQFDFFARGLWRVQNKFEPKIREGQGKLLLFFHNFRLDYFFFKWESKAGRWDDPAN